MRRKVPKEHYPLIAAMRLSGSKWAEIAAIYGCTPGHLMDLRSEIMEGFSEAERLRKSDMAATVALHLAYTSDKDETRLSAARSLMKESDQNDGGSESEVRDDREIIEEVKIELSSTR